MPLLEAVPNVSEGRDLRAVQELAAVLGGEPGVRLLDVSSDPDHHRSVLTAVGELSPLVSGLYALVRAVVLRIDLRRHSGVHPRTGAVDLVPFVPLDGAAMSDAVAAAERLGRAIGDQLEIPVFLYGHATRGGGRRLPVDLRRRGLAGLAAALEAGDLRPDFGPARIHPSAGAVLIGARSPMVAFNVWLASGDVEVARAVARAIRESGGGLPGVQALGLYLVSRRQAQVSVNLLRPDETSLYAVMERISHEARARGVEIDRGEIVGLLPEAVALRAEAAEADALRSQADALHLSELLSSRILERRLLREPEP